MPRRPSPTLTDGELRLMAVLWARGDSTVLAVRDALPPAERPAYNTVLTVLQIMERKGFVRHRKVGRAFVFAPTVGRGEASRNAVKHLLDRFFENRPELLVLNLLQDGDIDEQELAELKREVDRQGVSRP